MVLVAVGEENGRDFRTSQVVIILQNALRPLTLLVTRVDEEHLLTRITHEVIIAAAGVVNRIVVDVHDINMGCDLHWAPQSISRQHWPCTRRGTQRRTW